MYFEGNYTCVPSYTTPDWLMVHILDDGSNDDNINLIKQHYHQTENWDEPASLLELSLQNNKELDQGEV